MQAFRRRPRGVPPGPVADAGGTPPPNGPSHGARRPPRPVTFEAALNLGGGGGVGGFPAPGNLAPFPRTFSLPAFGSFSPSSIPVSRPIPG